MEDRFKIGLFDNVEWIGYDIANYGCDSVLLYGAKIGDNAKDVYETIVSNGWYGYEQEFGYSFMGLLNDHRYHIAIYADENGNMSEWYLMNWPEGNDEDMWKRIERQGLEINQKSKVEMSDQQTEEVEPKEEMSAYYPGNFPVTITPYDFHGFGDLIVALQIEYDNRFILCDGNGRPVDSLRGAIILSFPIWT